MPGCIRAMSISFSSFGLWLAVSTAVTDHWDSAVSVFLKLLVIAVLVALNGFFVACEFAIVKVRSSQLDALAEEGNVRASFAKHIRAHLDAYLSADPTRHHSCQSRARISGRTLSRSKCCSRSSRSPAFTLKPW